MPSHWASLRATAYVGVEDIRIHCCGQTETYPKERKGTRKVRYRHYLSELSKKPQAIRQVAPKLATELGEPYGGLWEMLTERYGARRSPPSWRVSSEYSSITAKVRSPRLWQPRSYRAGPTCSVWPPTLKTVARGW